jgi:uncharacterized C2H2 Zn-finger protein
MTTEKELIKASSKPEDAVKFVDAYACAPRGTRLTIIAGRAAEPVDDDDKEFMLIAQLSHDNYEAIGGCSIALSKFNADMMATELESALKVMESNPLVQLLTEEIHVRMSALVKGLRDGIKAIEASSPEAEASFTCPKCGTVSYNKGDIANGYCGRCHTFTQDVASNTGSRGRESLN